MNQMHKHDYDVQQRQTLTEAKDLAEQGREFSHLCAKMDAEHRLRLMLYVQGLPNDIARKTIYGRSVTDKEEKGEVKPKRPRCRGDRGR